MNTEPLGALTDLTTALMVMFIFPVLTLTGFISNIRHEYALRLTRDLAEDICVSGVLKEERYESYLRRLGAAGSYTVSICSSSLRYEPEYDEGSFTGNVKSYEAVTVSDTVLGLVYSKGSCSFREGDYVTIEAVDPAGSYVAGFGTIEGKEGGAG